MAGSDSWSAIDDRFPRLYWRLDEEAYTAFGRYGTLHEADEGEIIVKEGMPSMSFFLVLEGEVALTVKGQEVARVGEHFSFGEMGMLLDLPRAGTATATKPSKLHRADPCGHAADAGEGADLVDPALPGAGGMPRGVPAQACPGPAIGRVDFDR